VNVYRPIKLAARLLLLTGVRTMELLAAQWSGMTTTRDSGAFPANA
jgi:hypothetical protein